MLRSSYDVAILGTDLPALVFGALAAKKGYRVLVLGQGGKDNLYEVEGYRFIRRPNLMWGFSDSAPIREVFRELALAPEMRNLPRPLQPTCNVVLPDARIEISHMKGLVEEEIAREFPGRLEQFREFTRSMIEAEQCLEALLRDTPVLPPATLREFFAYRRYRKDVARFLPDGDADALALFESHPRLAAFFTAPLAAMSYVTEPRAHPLAFIKLANHLLRGLSFVEWGSDALKALFLERIRNNSGDVRLSDRVDMLIARYGEIREVELRARDESIGAGVVVAGTSLAPLLECVSESGRKRRFHQRVENTRPTHYIVTLNIAARRAVIPEGMAHIAFVVADPTKPLEGNNWLMVHRDPAMEPEENLDPDRTTIAVSGRLPAARFSFKPSEIEAFTHEMLNTLRRFMPFLDEHMVTLSTAAIGTNPRTGEPVVDLAGLVPLYKETVPRSLDLLIWPCRTAYKNLLFLGDEASGALGFEGAFLAAFMAFEVLKKKIRLKNMVGG